MASDALSFDDAIELAHRARERYGLEVQNISYNYRDDDGAEHWSLSLKRRDDVTGPRVTINTLAEWDMYMAQDCQHRSITLEPACDGSYGAMATCTLCGAEVGGIETQAATNPGYANRCATMLAELRLMFHNEAMRR